MVNEHAKLLLLGPPADNELAGVDPFGVGGLGAVMGVLGWLMVVVLQVHLGGGRTHRRIGVFTGRLMTWRLVTHVRFVIE